MDSTRSLSHLRQSGSLTWSLLNCKNKTQHDNSNGILTLHTFTWRLWRYPPPLSLKPKLSHLQSRTGGLNRVSVHVIPNSLTLLDHFTKKTKQNKKKPKCDWALCAGSDVEIHNVECLWWNKAIWTFLRFLSPSVDAGKSPPIPYIYVNSSGSVKNYRPMQVMLACSLEMYAFPFDKQNCSLTFRSWLHSGSDPETQPA